MEVNFAAQVAELCRERPARAPSAAVEERARRQRETQQAHTTPRRDMRQTVTPTNNAGTFQAAAAAAAAAAAQTPAAAQTVRTASARQTDAMGKLESARHMMSIRDSGLISAAEFDAIMLRLVQGLASWSQPPLPTPTYHALRWQQLPPQPTLQQQQPSPPISSWPPSPRLSLAERVQHLELERLQRHPPSPLLSPSPSLQPPSTLHCLQMEVKDAEIARLRAMLAGSGATCS